MHLQRPLLLRSRGRGKDYGVLRALVESTLRVAYRGDWPARLWGAMPGRCEVEVVRYELAVLPEGSVPLRLAYASDLHLGPTTPAPLLDRAFAHLSAARPDVLLLGGDYVFLDATEERALELAERIRTVPAPHRLAVLGNHDLWTEHHLLERALLASGVRVHVNATLRLPAPHGGIAVAGLDDPWTGEPQVETTLRAAGDAHTVVVLCHSPEAVHAVDAYAELMPQQPEIVYVCGHTHGGHIATPFGPLVVPGRVGRRHPRGLHRLARTSLVVSKGVGGIELPIRAFARPDVLVLDLVPRSRSSAPTKQRSLP